MKKSTWAYLFFCGAVVLPSHPAVAGLFDDLKSLGGKVVDTLTTPAAPSAQPDENDPFGFATPRPAEVVKPVAPKPAEADQAQKPAAKPVDERKSYSLFYDQGDHLKELIAAGQFEAAERLFAEHKAGFFEQKGALDFKTRMDKYATELRTLADSLNGKRAPVMAAQAQRLLAEVEKPHDQKTWLAWRSEMQNARTLADDYRAHPLLSVPIYQDRHLMALENALLAAESRIRERAVEVVLNNPPDRALHDLTSAYPVSVDIGDLVSRRAGQLKTRLADQGYHDIVAFHRVFGSHFPESLLRDAGDLLIAKTEIKGVGETRLRLAMKAYQDVKAMGLKPDSIPGLRVLYAERADLRKNNDLKFGTQLQRDVPLMTETVEFDALTGTVEGNFMIVLDIAKLEAQRKDGWLKRVRSKYLSGHRNIPNPAYAEAKAAYEQARSAHENAASQDCSRDRGYGCAIAKTILIAAAGAKMAETQKTVFSTPEFLSEPVYNNYDYRTSKVEVRKRLTGKAYFVDMGALLFQVIPVEMSENASFPLVHELHAEDTQYASIMAAHKTEQDIDQYADRPMAVKLSTLVDKYLGDNARAYSLASLDQLLAAIAAGEDATAVAKAPAVPVPVPAAPVAVDESVQKLQAQLLAQRQQIRADAQRKRLEEELARLNESHAQKFTEDLQDQLVKSLSAAKTPNLHVLVVGVSDYADVPDVPFAERSAQLFTEIAKKTLGAKDENVITLTDADATSGRLRGRLRTLLNRLGPDDRLLLYFAGHGVPSKDGKSAYLLAQDGGPGSYEEPDLQLDQLYAAIDKSRVGQASLFIDACFSGRSDKNSIVFEGVGGITLVPKHGLRPDSRISVITAGKNDQFSNQDKTHGHRLFGYHLMKALLEDGPNQTAEQLHAKLRDRVLSDSRRIGPEFEQEPELQGNGKVAVGR